MNFMKDPYRMRRLRLWSYIALFAVFAADFFVHRHHVEFVWDAIPGFSAVYGFISCVLIIRVSKGVGHAWLMKKEDYYD